MTDTFIRQGRYFEEFEVGDTFVSAGRTVTETDIVNFAGITGDYTQIHTNVEVARQGVFGRRIAHGMLGLSLASGLLVQLGFIEGTVLALRELTWKFSQPVFIGDTIHTEAMVAKLKPLPRLGGGALTLDVRVVNQEDETVQRGKWVLLIATRPT